MVSERLNSKKTNREGQREFVVVMQPYVRYTLSSTLVYRSAYRRNNIWRAPEDL